MTTISQLSIRDDPKAGIIVRWSILDTATRVRWRWIAKAIRRGGGYALVSGSVGARIDKPKWEKAEVVAGRNTFTVPRRPGFQVAVEISPLVTNGAGAPASATIWCLDD